MRTKDVVSGWLDRSFPLREEHALAYRKLAGVAIAAGGFIGAETWDWVERNSSHIVDPTTALGVTATAATTGFASLLWNRARRAEKDEQSY